MNNIRRSYQESNDKLRRARRLYKALVSESVLNNPVMCIFFAVRAIENGLYSDKNVLSDVAHSIWTGSYKHQSKQMNWKDMEKFGRKHSIWFAAKTYFKKTANGYIQIKKPRIRIKTS